MARIFHGEYYFVDINDEWSKKDLTTELFNKFNIQPDTHFIEESEEFEWDDDLAINVIGCSIEEFKKYFGK